MEVIHALDMVGWRNELLRNTLKYPLMSRELRERPTHFHIMIKRYPEIHGVRCKHHLFHELLVRLTDRLSVRHLG